MTDVRQYKTLNETQAAIQCSNMFEESQHTWQECHSGGLKRDRLTDRLKSKPHSQLEPFYAPGLFTVYAFFIQIRTNVVPVVN